MWDRTVAAIIGFLTNIAALWFSDQKAREAGKTDAKGDRAVQDLQAVKTNVELQQKVDDEISRLSPDDRRERLRQWTRRTVSAKRPDGGNGG